MNINRFYSKEKPRDKDEDDLQGAENYQSQKVQLFSESVTSFDTDAPQGRSGSSLDALLIETPEGKILNYNAATCQLYGYSKDEFQHLSLADLFPADIAQRLPGMIQTQLEQGEAAFETFGLKKDQQVFPCKVHTMLTTLSDKQYLVMSVRDLTHQKQAEEEMRLIHNDLEKRVTERTGELESAIERLEEGLQQRKQTEQTLQQRVMQLALLNEVGKRIAALMDLDSVLAHAANLVQKSFNYHHVALFLLNDQQGNLVMRAKAGDFVHLFPDGHQLSLNQGMVGWVGLNGEMLLSNNVNKEPRYINLYPNTVSICSELSVPLKVGRQVVGVLDVQSPRCDAFDKNDVLVIETLADQIAVAIENARLYEAIKQELAERRRAEESLHESEKRYRTLVETSPDAIMYIDRQVNILLCNQQAAKLFGYDSPDEMLGTSALQFAQPEQRPGILQKIEKLQPGWNIRNQEFELLKQNGETFTADVSATLVQDSDTSVGGVLAVTRDITKRKRLERYMLRTERLVAMGNIAAILAHEIKNPLQAIQSNMELVLDFSLDPDEQAEHLRLCYQDVERLVELTNRILNFTNPPKTAYRATTVSDLVQQTLRLLKEPLQQARVKVTTNVTRVPSQAQVASEQVAEVLLNLVLNAVEAMPDGGQIHITACLEEDEMICITVTNSNSQIAPEHMEYIFDPFFTTKNEGTGLGLYISYNIIQQLGGLLTAENLPDGGGVKFCMVVPASAAKVES
jgi:PAS domain S-box-containing protein